MARLCQEISYAEYSALRIGAGAMGRGNGVPGGTGGGVIYIECDEFAFPGSGVMSARGADGQVPIFDGGSGSGGGGGVILVRARKITSNAGTVSIAGGAGGSSENGYFGGNGGDGFWDIVQLN